MAAEASPVTWPEIISVASVVGVVFVAVVGGLVRAIVGAKKDLADQAKDLANHRVETATKFQDYVSKDGMREVERRIEESIKSLREEFGRGFQTLVGLFNARPDSE